MIDSWSWFGGPTSQTPLLHNLSLFVAERDLVIDLDQPVERQRVWRVEGQGWTRRVMKGSANTVKKSSASEERESIFSFRLNVFLCER